MPTRRRDNQTAPLWIEAGEDKSTPLISVAPAAPIDKIYTYTATLELLEQLRIGQRVSVPFGRKGTPSPAYVVAIEQGTWNSTLKPITEILDPAGNLSNHLLELGKWIARYYCCPLGRTLSAMIPQVVRKQSGFVTQRFISLAATADTIADHRLGAKQQTILQELMKEQAHLQAADLLKRAAASRATLKSLLKRGLIVETISKALPKDLECPYPRNEPDFQLNVSQKEALAHITDVLCSQEFRVILLYGRSGSGKTEVYVRAIRRVLAAGKQAIMLVPEIALTTQLMQRLAERFDHVAVIHSGLTGVQRSLAWERIRNRDIHVVIGTRSAVFAPCPDLGLIVVDEEQEPSYKNLRSPRFHVRDVAIKRAHLLNIPIILGSATPSLETWHNAHHHRAYTCVTLPSRVKSLPMPSVRLIDMRNEPSAALGATISRQLAEALRETLAKKQQAVILLNRRGFASWLFCPRCKMRIQCHRCNACMVLHLAQNRIRCHQCNLSEPIPIHCPDHSCRGKLVHGGGGTEKIEQQLHTCFPDARVLRADSDTMTHARKYRHLVNAFENRELDILIGTQMIAKGLDFPNVSLVGVIGAEPPAALSDFRANERLFQLVTQVAGRAGRADATGLVIVQSMNVDSPALRHAVHHDFDSFAAVELPRRQAMHFPPFTRLTRFILAGPREGDVMEQARCLADRLKQHIAETAQPDCVVLGPHPCVMERAKNMYRYELLLRAASASAMLSVLDSARHDGALRVNVKSFVLDVDPLSLS